MRADNLLHLVKKLELLVPIGRVAVADSDQVVDALERLIQGIAREVAADPGSTVFDSSIKQRESSIRALIAAAHLRGELSAGAKGTTSEIDVSYLVSILGELRSAFSSSVEMGKAN